MCQKTYMHFAAPYTGPWKSHTIVYTEAWNMHIFIHFRESDEKVLSLCYLYYCFSNFISHSFPRLSFPLPSAVWCPLFFPTTLLSLTLFYTYYTNFILYIFTFYTITNFPGSREQYPLQKNNHSTPQSLRIFPPWFFFLLFHKPFSEFPPLLFPHHNCPWFFFSSKA